MSITLVVAMAHNRVIGNGNQLPWHLPEDLKHFKALTTGHCLIMGRKTFDSIGKALPNRRTIVVTRQSDWQHAGCETADSIESAIAAAKSNPEQRIFIVGGAQIYAQALGLADCVVATEIDLTVQGDAWFPQLDLRHWRCVKHDDHVSSNGLAFSVKEYQR